MNYVKDYSSNINYSKSVEKVFIKSRKKSGID